MRSGLVGQCDKGRACGTEHEHRGRYRSGLENRSSNVYTRKVKECTAECTDSDNDRKSSVVPCPAESNQKRRNMTATHLKERLAAEYTQVI